MSKNAQSTIAMKIGRHGPNSSDKEWDAKKWD